MDVEVVVDAFNVPLYGYLETRLSLNVPAFVEAFNGIPPNKDVAYNLARHQTAGIVHVNVSRPIRYLPVLDTEVVEPRQPGGSLWWSFTSVPPDQLADGIRLQVRIIYSIDRKKWRK